MNKRNFFLTVAVVAIFLPLTASADRPTSTNMVFVPGFAPVPGSVSTIQRNAGGFTATAQTSFLQSQVYTMWILVWNDASNHPGCDPEADFCTPGTMDCVIYGTGHLVGASGIGNFATSLSVGDTSRIFGGGNCPAGLTDARTAEIHLVIADHGGLDPAQMPDAIKTPGPGVQAACMRRKTPAERRARRRALVSPSNVPSLVRYVADSRQLYDLASGVGSLQTALYCRRLLCSYCAAKRHAVVGPVHRLRGLDQADARCKVGVGDAASCGHAIEMTACPGVQGVGGRVVGTGSPDSTKCRLIETLRQSNHRGGRSFLGRDHDPAPGQCCFDGRLQAHDAVLHAGDGHHGLLRLHHAHHVTGASDDTQVEFGCGIEWLAVRRANARLPTPEDDDSFTRRICDFLHGLELRAGYARAGFADDIQPRSEYSGRGTIVGA